MNSEVEDAYKRLTGERRRRVCVPVRVCIVFAYIVVWSCVMQFTAKYSQNNVTGACFFRLLTRNVRT